MSNPAESDDPNRPDGEIVSPAVGAAFEALRDDYNRQGQLLHTQQVERLVSKRKLPIEQIITLYELLTEAGIAIQLPAVGGGTLSASSLPPVLRPDEELELGRRIELGRQAGDTRDDDSSQPSAVVAIRDAAREAKAVMIERNLRLVHAIAKAFEKVSDLELSDLAQEGTIGLMHAVERFDVARGCKFSTYAVWWIRQAILRALANRGTLIRFPVHVAEDVRRFKRAKRYLGRRLYREPTAAEIADELDWKIDKAIFIEDLTQMNPIPFDAPARGSEGQSFAESLVSPLPSPLDVTVERETAERMESVISTLKPKQAEIIRLRFGIDDGQERTLESIGAMMGVTRERIRQIEAKALEVLKKRLVKHGLDELFEIED